MAQTTSDFEDFLGAEGPEDAQDRLDLVLAAQNGERHGRYHGSRLPDGRTFIKGAEMRLFLASPKAVAAFIQRLHEDVSEPGASFEGDAEYERSMQKDN